MHVQMNLSCTFYLRPGKKINLIITRYLWRLLGERTSITGAVLLMTWRVSVCDDVSFLCCACWIFWRERFVTRFMYRSRPLAPEWHAHTHICTSWKVIHALLCVCSLLLLQRSALSGHLSTPADAFDQLAVFSSF